MQRVGVPLVTPDAFREAVANALTHRDYARLGAIHVRLESESLVISNPGGFVEGVTVDNLLATEPHPRNPRLADAFKRIGLVERTGRGVDLIYRHQHLAGRAAPDYSASTSTTVVLRLSTAPPDLPLVRALITAEERLSRPLTLKELRLAYRLRSEDVWALEAMGPDTAALEALSEAGLVVVDGERVRLDLESSSIAAVAESGSPPSPEEAVLRLARERGSVRRRDVMRELGLSGFQATQMLGELVSSGALAPRGSGRARHYVVVPATISND